MVVGQDKRRLGGDGSGKVHVFRNIDIISSVARKMTILW